MTAGPTAETENNFLRSDDAKFPRGMGFVADEIHDLGLLFGMYSSAGEMTCARYGTPMTFLHSANSACVHD